MKAVKILFSVAICVWVMAKVTASDSVPVIKVEYISQSTEDYVKAINTIGKIMLSEGKAIIEFTDGTKQDLGYLENMGKISFTKVDASQLSGEDDDKDAITEENKFEVTVYPNPSSEIIHIKGIEEGSTVRLFNGNGQLIKSVNESEIDIQDLTNGEYLLQAGNNIVRIIKK